MCNMYKCQITVVNIPFVAGYILLLIYEMWVFMQKQQLFYKYDAKSTFFVYTCMHTQMVLKHQSNILSAYTW